VREEKKKRRKEGRWKGREQEVKIKGTGSKNEWRGREGENGRKGK
jgi:hypothetical protein